MRGKELLRLSQRHQLVRRERNPLRLLTAATQQPELLLKNGFYLFNPMPFLSLVTRFPTLTFWETFITSSSDPAVKHWDSSTGWRKRNEGVLPAELQATVGASGSLSPWQEVFGGEMDGGNPSFPSTTSLVPLSHKAVPSGRAVITHFTALILITANVNIRIININAQNNAVICNYRVALIFLPSPPPHRHFSRCSSSSNLLSPSVLLRRHPPPPSSPGFNVITPPFHSELI